MLQSARQADDTEGAEGTPTDRDRTGVCPLCSAVLADSAQVYAHLQTTHRKSELAGLVIDR